MIALCRAARTRANSAYALFVIEPTARVGDRQRHGGETLGGRVNDHHRVLFPGLTRLLVPDTAPEIDDASRRDDIHSTRSPARGVEQSYRRTPDGPPRSDYDPSLYLAAHKIRPVGPGRGVQGPQQDSCQRHHPEQRHADTDALPDPDPRRGQVRRDAGGVQHVSPPHPKRITNVTKE